MKTVTICGNTVDAETVGMLLKRGYTVTIYDAERQPVSSYADYVEIGWKARKKRLSLSRAIELGKMVDKIGSA